MKGLVQRVVDLSDEESRNILDTVVAEFRDRHRDLEEAFRLGYERVKNLLPPAVSCRKQSGSSLARISRANILWKLPLCSILQLSLIMTRAGWHRARFGLS